MSVRLRLALIFTLIAGTLIVIFATSLYTLVSKQFENILRRNVQYEVDWAADIFEQLGNESFELWDRETADLGIIFQLRDEDGSLIYQTRSEKNNNDVITLSREIKSKDKILTLEAISSREDLSELNRTIRLFSILLVPLLLIISFMGGYFFSKRVVSPLEEGYARMKQFTGDASHELRVPLAGLKASLEIPLRKERSSQEYKEAIKDALDETNQLSRLTDDLLILARVDEATREIRKELVNVDILITEVITQAGSIFKDKGISITKMRVPEVELKVDPTMIKRALLNLLENAIKYNKDKGTVQIGAEIIRNNVVISVVDSGPGIAEQDQKRIFRRFYRVDKARVHSGMPGGTGLGLSIVKSIVEAHGGKVIVQSILGQGSTFKIVLPQD